MASEYLIQCTTHIDHAQTADAVGSRKTGHKRERGPERVALTPVRNGCPAASYSPTPSPGQYHRR
jgi:hypothetical protein